MPFTDDYDLEKPSEGAENAGESINDNSDKIEDGRTIKLTLGEDFANEGLLGYIKSDGEAWLAKADAAATSRAIGFITAAGLDGAERYFRNNGFIEYGSWTLTVGDGYWLSDSVDGGVTNVKPTIAIFVGIARTTTKIQIIGLAPFDNATGSGATQLSELSDVSGVDYTAGYVLRGNGAGGYVSAQLGHGDLSGVGTDDHHAQSHSHASHSGIGLDDHHDEDHESRHNEGGDDALKLDDLAEPDDNTDLDFSTTKHGLTPKGTNTGKFLKDDGSWGTPAGGGGGGEEYAIARDPVGGATANFLGVLCNGASEIGYASILVPEDFSSIDAIEVVLMPNLTGASMHIEVGSVYGNYDGEDKGAYQESASGRDIGATVTNQNLAHDVSDLVDAHPLAGGDLLTFWVRYDSTSIACNLYFRGLRLKWS